ncbi:MAG: molybdopterin molybdotransferase MoeA [Niastella sp.]|nr:molybdopterin molybdotransferase MoeA [Niastella sp.]
MLSVEQAKVLISANTTLGLPITIPLENALGKVLAASIYADISIPAFEQSAMDGYAFRYDTWKQQPLQIAGEMAAGAKAPLTITAGQAARIFTGAPLPAGADTVVMQEKVRVNGNELIIDDVELQPGFNVRGIGAEIRAGELALPNGALLTPAAIGFLAGMGMHKVAVYPSPSITIIVTGDELQKPGASLEYGQVYESNSYTLRTALQQMQVGPVAVMTAEDDFDILLQTVAAALSASDMVLITGGVSVGNYDYVAQALETCGVTQIFHKLRQRPGKPLYFGKRDEQLVFGLPGNPSSVLTCFYEYVYPCIREQMGYPQPALPVMQMRLLNDFHRKPGLTQFLKGYWDKEGVRVLQAQESFRMHSFAVGNCLIVVPEETGDILKGQMVEVHLLPV